MNSITSATEHATIAYYHRPKIKLNQISLFNHTYDIKILSIRNKIRSFTYYPMNKK